MKDFFNALSAFFGIEYKDVVITAIPVILTLFTFFFGYFINGSLSYIKEMISRRNYRRLFKINYKALKDYISTQIGLFEMMQLDLTINTRKELSILRNTNFALTSFKELGYSISYKAFFGGFRGIFYQNKNKLKVFNEVYTTLSIIEELQQKGLTSLISVQEQMRHYIEIIEKSNKLAFNEIKKVNDKHINSFNTKYEEYRNQRLALIKKLNSSERVLQDLQNFFKAVNILDLQNLDILDKIIGVENIYEYLDIITTASTNIANYTSYLTTQKGYIFGWQSQLSTQLRVLTEQENNLF